MISEIVIGMGASIGRENAPKLMGGAAASVLAAWAAACPPAQRRLLMACGGGAGLAAVDLDVPSYGFTAPLLTWVLLAGPLIGLVACCYIRLIGWITHHQVSGRAVLVAPAVASGFSG